MLAHIHAYMSTLGATPVVHPKGHTTAYIVTPEQLAEFRRLVLLEPRAGVSNIRLIKRTPSKEKP